MKYIMITHWKDHWNKLPGNQTHYTFGMLKEGVDLNNLKNNTPTVFIKLNEDTKEPEKAWEGVVYDFEINKKRGRVYFKVKINREILVPEKYKTWKEGWYMDEEKLPRKAISEGDILYKAILLPPFFYILKETNNWEKFEKYTHWLLKLLGINEIYKYERQKGTADGFFKFGNLAVIYDATLESNFEETKKEQIRNYYNQLKNGRLEYQKTVVDVLHCKKQVWIITKGKTRQIMQVDEVVVKEVSLDSLIKIYLDRVDENLNSDELENRLRNI